MHFPKIITNSLLALGTTALVMPPRLSIDLEPARPSPRPHNYNSTSTKNLTITATAAQPQQTTLVSSTIPTASGLTLTNSTNITTVSDYYRFKPVCRYVNPEICENLYVFYCLASGHLFTTAEDNTYCHFCWCEVVGGYPGSIPSTPHSD